MPHTRNNHRIAKNTAFLYVRLLLTMGVTLYSSRVILNTLGVEDFGIYSIVGGIVIMFTFLSNALGGATSRFLTFEIGKKNSPQFSKIFSAALVIHVFLAFIIFLIAETIGLWLLMNKLVIPAARMDAAHWVYQFSVMSCMISIMQIPYNVSIIANERMDIYAYITISDATLRLIIIYFLTLADFDKLKVYAVLIFSVSIITTSVYRIYCKRQYKECSFSFHLDKKLYKTLLAYSAWDLFGNLALVGMGQGLNLLLNIFFGPIVNAAQTISYQVQGAISGFVNSFLIAAKPQIIKLYAEGSVKYMMNMVFATSKYSFFLIYFFSLPVMLETHFILDAWLKIIPDHTARFCQLILINNWLVALRNPIVTSFHATGHIKLVNLVSGSILLSILPIAYLFLARGFPPESVFIVTIGVVAVTQISELLLLKRLITYSVIAYIKQVILPCVFIGVITAVPPYMLTITLAPGIVRFILVGFTCVTTILTAVYFCGMDRDARQLVRNKISALKQKYIS